MSSTGAGFTSCSCTHSYSYSHTHRQHTHTRKGQGSGHGLQPGPLIRSAVQDTPAPGPQLQPLPQESEHTVGGPPAHLPSGVLLVNIVDHLTSKPEVEMQAAPGTGQHQQATEGGQERHILKTGLRFTWRGKDTRHRCFFLSSSVQVLNTHKASPQDALFWGPRPILSSARLPLMLLGFPSRTRVSAECLQGPLGTCGLSCLVSESQPVLTAQDCTMD